MNAADWRRGGRYRRCGDFDIFYRDAGSGDALLCIHGFPTASWDWHRMWPGLTRRFRVLAPDLLGFGFSAKPADHAYSIFEQTTLLEDLLSAAGFRQVVAAPDVVILDGVGHYPQFEAPGATLDAVLSFLGVAGDQ